MELQFQEMLTQITSFMKSEAKTETVVGDAFELGEFTCIPVIRVGLGFGTGGGEGDDSQRQREEASGRIGPRQLTAPPRSVQFVAGLSRSVGT